MISPEAKMVLTGGRISEVFVDTIQELSGATDQTLVIDLSPCSTEALFTKTRGAFEPFFGKYFSSIKWLQDDLHSDVDNNQVHDDIDSADILFVAGGSTREAYRQWQRLGITDRIIERVNSGAMVGSGGSAGAMIWFQNGYSDSRSYEVDEDSRWNYVNVPAAGFVPAWVTAHYKDVDDFGRRRDQGFKRDLRRHAGEWQYAFGIETHSAIVCDNGMIEAINLQPDVKSDTVHFFDARDGVKPMPLQSGDTIKLTDLIYA